MILTLEIEIFLEITASLRLCNAIFSNAVFNNAFFICTVFINAIFINH